MEVKGVVVHVTNGTKKASCSGIRFGNHVLTSGVLLVTFVNDADMEINSTILKYLRFSSMIDNNTETNRNAGRATTVVNAQLLTLWQCPLLLKCFSTQFTGWSLGDKDVEDRHEKEVVEELVTSLVLLRLEGGIRDTTVALTGLLDMLDRGGVYRSMPVLVESTPFALEPFFNSWSEGVVSNVRGPVVVTDARLVVGCEGAPLFRRGTPRQLLGMVLGTMCWKRGEWVGFSLAVLLVPALESRLYRRGRSSIPALPAPKSSGICSKLSTIESCVVFIRCGGSWGSGVVVDKLKGIILTCTHVISNFIESGSAVQVISCAQRFPAKVVYYTPIGLHYDLAVLHIGLQNCLTEFRISKSSPIKGEAVFTVGYSLFPETALPCLATVSSGVITNVSPDSHGPVQTSCCVQSGASGGAVVRPNGQLIAIINFNTRSPATGSLYPHVNYGIPASVFRMHLNQYRLTNDISHLLNLTDRSPRTVWSWSLGKAKL